MADCKMTVGELTRRMREYNRRVAPGSECTVWQDYVEDMTGLYGLPPWDDELEDWVVDDNVRDYWVDVANDVSPDYDGDGGGV